MPRSQQLAAKPKKEPMSKPERAGFNFVRKKKLFGNNPQQLLKLFESKDEQTVLTKAHDWCLEKINASTDAKDTITQLTNKDLEGTGVSMKNDGEEEIEDNDWWGNYDTVESDFVDGCAKGVIHALKQEKLLK